MCTCLPFLGAVSAQNQDLGVHCLPLLPACRNTCRGSITLRRVCSTIKTTFLVHEAECTQPKTTENRTRKYSTSSIIQTRTITAVVDKIYISCAYTKPREHLIKVTVVEVEKIKKTSIPFLIFIGPWLRTLRSRDQHMSQEQEPRGAAARSGALSEKKGAG